MAGSRSKSKGRSPKGPGDHAREAVAEWGKAFKHGRAALAPVAKNARAAVTDRLGPASGNGSSGNGSGNGASGKASSAKGSPAKGSSAKRASGNGSSGKKSLAKRLNPAETEKGGRVGDAADALLAKLGPPGKLASKVSLGSRAVERLKPNINLPNINLGNGSSGRAAPLPIQESVEIAVPIGVAWELATRAEDYPEFLERVSAAEMDGENGARFDAKVRGIDREVEVEILEEQPRKRLAWKASGGHDHIGVASFHELAPTLTHVELSVVLDSHGLVQRLARTTHLTQHAIRSDLQGFKAYAELWQDEEDLEQAAAASADDEPEAEADDEPEAEADDEPDAQADDEEPEEEPEDEDEPPEAEADDDEEDEDEGEQPDPKADDAEDEDDEDFEEDTGGDEPPEHAYSEAIENYESEDAYAEVAD